MDDLASVIQEKDDPIQDYSVDTESGKLIDLDKGGSLFVPKEAFVHLDGTQVTGPVDIEVIEAYQLTDFMSHGLLTESKGELLETGGMLYINATVDGQQVELAENRSIEIIYPNQALEEGMELFYAEETEEDMTWAPTGKALGTTQLKNDPLLVDLDRILNIDFGEVVKPVLQFEPLPKRPTLGHKPYPPSDKLYTYEKYQKLYAQYEENLEAWHNSIPVLDKKLAAWNKEVDNRLEEIEAHQKDLVEFKAKVKVINQINGLRGMQGRRAPIELIQKIAAFMGSPIRIYVDDREVYQIAFQNQTRDLIAERKLEVNIEGFEMVKPSFPFARDLNKHIRELQKKADELAFRETGRIDRKGFGSYVAGISQLGWINCDRFSGGEYELSNLTIGEVDAETRFYMIYKDQRSFIGARVHSGEAVYENVAVGEAVKLVSLKLIDDKPYMAIRDFVLGRDEYMVMNYLPCDLEQIRNELNSVDPTVSKVKEETYELTLKVFPNPTTDAFTAVTQPAENLNNLSIYDINGGLVKNCLLYTSPSPRDRG